MQGRVGGKGMERVRLVQLGVHVVDRAAFFIPEGSSKP